MSSQSAETPRFGLGKSIAFSLVLMGFFFSLVEGGLRAYVYAFRSPAEVWDFSAQTFALRPGEHRRVGAAPIVVNSRGFVGREFEDPPPPGTLRIVALGDSCTFGQATLDGHYPALLEKLLNARPDGQRFQVINAGIEGLNSELALRRLQSKVVPLAPDLVTVYIGWNDLMKFDPAGQTERPSFAIIARVLDKLWTVRGLRKLLFYHLRPRLRPPATGPESRTGRFADYGPAVFEENLRAIVGTARGAGARVALLTLPSVVDEKMSPEELQRANVQFPYFPSAYGVGDFVDLIEAYNRAIRRVAASENVQLVDLAQTINARPDRRTLFLDNMHPNGRGREVLAELVADGLRDGGVLSRPPHQTRTSSLLRAQWTGVASVLSRKSVISFPGLSASLQAGHPWGERWHESADAWFRSDSATRNARRSSASCADARRLSAGAGSAHDPAVCRGPREPRGGFEARHS